MTGGSTSILKVGKLDVTYSSQYVSMVGHTVNWQMATGKRLVGICSMVQQQGDNVRVS